MSMHNGMVGAEMPSISKTMYATKQFDMHAALVNAAGQQANNLANAISSGNGLGGNVGAFGAATGGGAFGAAKAQWLGGDPTLRGPERIFRHEMEAILNKDARRLVRVFVSDPDPRVGLDDCILYRGSEHLTESTDQELYFELNIKELLDKHNEKRTKVVDDTVKDRTEYLKPVKIRDLRMVVVEIAVF